MPGRPNSRGRLSLNLLTDPERSTKKKGKQSPEKQARGSPRLKNKKKEKKKKKKEESVGVCVGRVSLGQLCKNCLSWGYGGEKEALSSMSCEAQGPQYLPSPASPCVILFTFIFMGLPPFALGAFRHAGPVWGFRYRFCQWFVRRR